MFVTVRNSGMAGALLSLLCRVIFSGDLLAQTKPTRAELGGEPPRSIMWAGNSFFYYNNSMHNHHSATNTPPA